jgi:hypothetical protein
MGRHAQPQPGHHIPNALRNAEGTDAGRCRSFIHHHKEEHHVASESNA